VSPSDQVYQPAGAPRVGAMPTAAGRQDRTAGPAPAAAMPQARPDMMSSAARPAPPTGAVPVAGPRTVRLTLARVDPWSVLKLSFLLSVALGIGLVTGAIVLWSVIDSMGVLDSVNKVLRDIDGSNSTFSLYDYVGLGRVISLSTFIGVINVVIIMALSTLGAFLYNIASSLVGGLHVTLSDD
jgi:Transmembrane domain of unknown function (DUF3566)